MPVPPPSNGLRSAMGFELFVWRRYLWGNRRLGVASLISLLSVAGVSVGVMALIVVLAVMAGFEDDLRRRIIGVQSHVVVDGREGNLARPAELAAALRGVDGVQAVSAFVAQQTLLSAGTGLSGVQVRGVDPVAGRAVLPFADLGLLAAPPPDGDAAPPILLGRQLARNLGVRAGDDVQLTAPHGMLSPFGFLPLTKRFRVCGTFASGMYTSDSTLAFVPLAAAQAFFRLGERVSGLEVRLDRLEGAAEVARRIRDRLGEGYRVQDWRQMNRNLFAALKLEKTVMFIVLSLIVLVAAFNIASALIMLVMEKTRDIAMLMVMGATTASIRRIFVLRGLAVGAVGTAAGTVAGLLACFLLKRYRFIELPKDIYYITTIPVRLEALDVAAITLAAVGLCLLASLYPARQAARLSCIEAIRYA